MAAKRAAEAPPPSGGAKRACEREPRPADELRYVFDLTGYVVLRGVLSADDVARANAAVDANPGAFHERVGALRNSKPGGAFAGDGATGRLDAGTMLRWPAPHCAVFRDLLAHPGVVPLLNDVCGEGYRLDHLPLVIRQRRGAEGFDFHGGAVGPDGRWREELGYEVRPGAAGPRVVARLVNVSFALTDTDPGDGGFVIVPGSHKSAFPLPPAVARGVDAELCRVPALRAGDAVVFSEATAHGALPWRAAAERRVAFYRFSPAGCAYGRGHSHVFGDALLRELTDAQRAVLSPPYTPRLSRPVLRVTADGEVRAELPQARAQEKRDFDSAVFGHEYF